MKIGVIGSMQYTEKMIELRDELIQMGHDAFLTTLANPFVGKTDEEKEEIKLQQKNNMDAIREFWRLNYKTEIEAVKPIILNGDLSKVS